MVASAAALASLGLFLSDVSRMREAGLTAITVFSLFGAATGLANALGLRAADGPLRPLYFLYAVDEHLMLASLLGLAGNVLPVLGFWVITRYSGLRLVSNILPPITGRVRDRSLVIAASVLALSVTALRLLDLVPPLGTISDVIFLVPNFAIFTLARVGAARHVRAALPTALVLALVEAFRGLVFEYLRLAAVLPIVALISGAVLGARSLRPLRTKVLLPIYPLGIIYVLYFGVLGEIRTSNFGAAKVTTLLEYDMKQAQGEDIPVPKQTILSRLSTFNQLSQIRRLVDEDGFYEGKTLSYLAYAFMPRFLFPDKPTIQRGSWFAVRIGQAIQTANGWYNNSINMTVQGELYLNWGWVGTLVGLPLYGALFGLFWQSARFWGDDRNALGAAFGFYVIWGSLGAAGDLTILVTTLAVYLIFLATSVGLRQLGLSTMWRDTAQAPA
ncbi:MAG: hypothetical protein M3068_08575 [Gemmatimonadota bacterium]|nr:hypothetical protein [Gemmatimonadota bacterium]